MAIDHELAPEQWAPFLDRVSEELRNAEVSIEIIGAPGPRQVQAHNLALQTLAYDRRGDVFEVSAARGGAHVPSVLRHLVDHPERIVIDGGAATTPSTIAIDDHDGVRTLVRIALPDSFAG
ncbi:MAG TPA: DUF5335 family protein [Thermoleophilaceae bacterium]|jgi:hypothetical protein